MSNKFNLTDLLLHTGVESSIAETWSLPLEEAMRKYEIVTMRRICAFIANILVESGKLTRLKENTNYSAERLKIVWPNRFSTNGRSSGQCNELALKLNRNPVLIANYVYANRLGNGDPSTGDGYKYRGHGPIQYTFKNNYQHLADNTGIDCLNNPEVLCQPKEGSISAAFFWYSNNINNYIDKDDFDGVCDMINKGHKTTRIGDANGYDERLKLYRSIYGWFAKKKFDSVGRIRSSYIEEAKYI